METLTQRRRNGHKDLKKRKEKSSQKNAKTRKKGHKRLKTEGNSLSKDTKEKKKKKVYGNTKTNKEKEK